MYKLNLIAIVSIVAAVSFVVGMTAPAAFAQDNLTEQFMTNTTNLNNTESQTGIGVNTTVTHNQTLPGVDALPAEGGSTLDMNMSNATSQ